MTELRETSHVIDDKLGSLEALETSIDKVNFKIQQTAG